jgi:ComEC/Rec2-related protein
VDGDGVADSSTGQWWDVKPRITVAVALVAAAGDALAVAVRGWAGAAYAPFVFAFLLASVLMTAGIAVGRARLGALLAVVCLTMSAWTVWRGEPVVVAGDPPLARDDGGNYGVLWNGIVDELQPGTRAMTRMRLRLAPAGGGIQGRAGSVQSPPLGAAPTFSRKDRTQPDSRTDRIQSGSRTGRTQPAWSGAVSVQAERVPSPNWSGAVSVQTELPASWIPDEVAAACARGEHPCVQLRGWLRPARRARFPWDFDQVGYLERDHVVALLRVCKGTVKYTGIAAAGPLEKLAVFFDSIRRRMVSLHRRCLGEQRGDLLSSIVIGDKAVRPAEEIRLQFRMLGLSHIVAASGFNLTIVVAVAWWTIRFLVRSRLLICLWCFAAIAIFASLAGLSASVERAALMCTVMLVMTARRRSVHLPASISLALTLTLFLDPQALFDAGLQLSYVATFALAGCVQRINGLIGEPGRFPFPEWIREAAVVVIAANLAVLPLQMIYFWQVGALSVVANILVSPLVAPITVLGFIASALGGMNLPAATFVGSAVDWLAGWALDLMMLIVRWLSSYRWSLIDVGPPLPAATACYYLALCAMVACLPGRDAAVRRPLLLAGAVCTFAIACALLFIRPQLAAPTLIVFSTAQVLVMPNGQSAIAGLQEDEQPSLKRALIYLRAKPSVYIPFMLPLFDLPKHRASASSQVFQIRGGKPVWVSDGEHLFDQNSGTSFSSSTL